MYSLLLLKLLQVVFLYQAITYRENFTGKNAIYGKYIPEDDVIQHLLGYID